MRRLWLIGLMGIGAGLAWMVSSRLWPERRAAWPSRKKLRREARRAEAMQRAQEQAPVRPPVVHVEKEAETGLKVPLGDLTR